MQTVFYLFSKLIEPEILSNNIKSFFESSINKILMYPQSYENFKDILEQYDYIIPLPSNQMNAYDVFSIVKENLIVINGYTTPIYGETIFKMAKYHKTKKNLYTYCDGADINLSFRFEIIDANIAEDVLAKKPIYPDGTLGLFDLDPSSAYLLDFEDQRFYYEKYFDKYFKQPKGINLEPTYLCNLHCTMCNYHGDDFDTSWKEGKTKYLDFDMYIKLIDEISQYDRIPTVELCYRGEPLLYKDIVKIVEYGSKKNVFMTMVTNALLLDEQMSKNILEAGLKCIYFSIDSLNENIYKEIRKGGDFKTALGNIDTFLTLNKRDKNILTYIKIVDLKENRFEQNEMILKWINKVDGVIIQNQTIRDVDVITKWASPSSYECLSETRYPCHLLWNNAMIAASGNVAHCGLFFEEKIEDRIGNLNEISLFDMWNSDDLNTRRKNMLDGNFEPIPMCGKCDGVACSNLLINKQIINDEIFLHNHAGVRIYTSIYNKKLYPIYGRDR